MKVLHVINSLGGSGGAEHGLVRETVRFSPDIDQLVVRLYAKDHLDSQLIDRGIPVVGLGMQATHASANWILATRRLSKIIRLFDPDVIHSSLFTANLVAQRAAHVTSRPVLSTLTLSGDVRMLQSYQPGASSARAALLRRVAAASARRKHVWFRALTADALTTNCELLGVGPERGVVIPRGVPADLPPAKPRSRAQLGLPADVPLVLNIGRQAAQKGHANLVQAFALVRPTTPAHLVIVGREGDTSAELHRVIARMGLSEHVTLVGYTPDAHHYLAHATVFAFSSLMEGLGTAVLEALAAGLPVVAFDIPPVREAVNGCRSARLVSPGDDHALASGIASLLGDPQAAAGLGMEGRRWVMDRYSIADIAARVERHLRQVASTASSVGAHA